MFISAGTAIATATYLHMELIKTIGGQSFRLDPTSFLQPNTEPVVTSQLQCNDVVTSVGGAVVDRRTFVTSPISRQLIGSSLTGDGTLPFSTTCTHVTCWELTYVSIVDTAHDIIFFCENL